MSSHWEATPIPYGDRERSMARWATQPAGTVVVFVHGFGGGVSTWDEFDELLPLEPRAAGADLVFFTYDGLRAPVLTSAAQLRDMLDELMTSPSRCVNGTLEPEDHRPASFAYHKLVLVAHSLGAVVTRKALLDAYRVRAPWLDRVELVLFAPAHRGAPVIDVARETLGLFHAAMMTVMKVVTTYSVLADLEPDSPLLADLRAQTERALSAGARTLAARHVATAAHDKVVAHLDFVLEDAPAVPLPGSHTSICKPSDNYTSPIEIVARFL